MSGIDVFVDGLVDNLSFNKLREHVWAFLYWELRSSCVQKRGNLWQDGEDASCMFSDVWWIENRTGLLQLAVAEAFLSTATSYMYA